MWHNGLSKMSWEWYTSEELPLFVWRMWKNDPVLQGSCSVTIRVWKTLCQGPFIQPLFTRECQISLKTRQRTPFLRWAHACFKHHVLYKRHRQATLEKNGDTFLYRGTTFLRPIIRSSFKHIFLLSRAAMAAPERKRYSNKLLCDEKRKKLDGGRL